MTSTRLQARSPSFLIPPTPIYTAAIDMYLFVPAVTTMMDTVTTMFHGRCHILLLRANLLADDVLCNHCSFLSKAPDAISNPFPLSHPFVNLLRDCHALPISFEILPGGSRLLHTEDVQISNAMVPQVFACHTTSAHSCPYLNTSCSCLSPKNRRSIYSCRGGVHHMQPSPYIIVYWLGL